MTTTHQRRPVARRLAALAVLTAGLLAGCGEDAGGGSSRAGAGALADVATFDDLPVPGRAEPVGPARDTDAGTVRSYLVRNSAAEEILAFYADGLDGWELVDEERSGDVLRAEWTRGELRLRVVAQRAPTAEPGDEDEPVVQLSLRLER